MLKIDFSNTTVLNEEILRQKEFAYFANEKLLHSKKEDKVGFIDLPEFYDEKELELIKKYSKEVREKAKVLVVIGIGGSYLGAKSAIDFLSSYYKKENDIEIIFVGNNLSEKYLSETLEYVSKKEFYINVISKSGGTLEPAVAFRFFRELANKKYGKDAKNHIIATTDKKKGILKKVATENKYRTLVINDDIGGRYSVFTSCGLFPIACAGYDVSKIIQGAKKIRKELLKKDITKNKAMQYAIIRNILYKKGKNIEVFSTFKPNMQYFTEWLKQLFGESEGKENKGIIPMNLTYTTDLHSMGQYMQEGRRDLFETFIDFDIEKNTKSIKINELFKDDELNYMKNYSVNDLNIIARKATIKAHVNGNVPTIEINFSKQDEETLGELFYFFMMTCAYSATMLGVNPFNQPGVEEYKKNIKEFTKNK